MNIRSQAVLDSAKGAPCAARFPGVCNGNPETTVWCHLNGYRFGKGAGLKAHDVCGFAGCSSCHAYLDVGHGTKPLVSTETLLECVIGAVLECYVRLIVTGVVQLPQDRAKPAHERPTKPRKAPAERQKLPTRPMQSSSRPIPSRPMRQKAPTP